ncbi:MarR family transcriptional regulator [Nocardioides anomalus]|uniref:MarR family transcriptional regulator n=1 Tax=Nocardioides anomalus TaxID=2712223 RepID=A0A6G6W8X2_9ACTN|nr:MarR family transcriptional regulator [Nocardioides anomalus]QIG41674.1 MarR family transcriptional regulator [Nocardioides anomalus]
MHRPDPHPREQVHRLFELVEPIATASFSDTVTAAFREVGLRDYWDGYFAGRAAPLGEAPPEVVHAVFYNFAPGEVARHLPWVWSRTTPEEALAVRERASAETLRGRLGRRADGPALGRAADLATRAATSAPTEGRALYAGLRRLAVPEEPVARLWHAATLLREYRGDSHHAVLLAHGIDGSEAHVMLALSWDMAAEDFDRLHHLPRPYVAAVVDGLRTRGLVDDDGRFTEAGRELSRRLEATTDALAARAYEVLSPAELDELVVALEALVPDA